MLVYHLNFLEDAVYSLCSLFSWGKGHLKLLLCGLYTGKVLDVRKISYPSMLLMLEHGLCFQHAEII